MKTKMFVVLSVLLIVGLACGATPQPQPGTDSQATKLPQETVSQAPIEQTYDEPNLQLVAFLIDSTATGNGLKTVSIGFSGENASNQWWTYTLINPFGEHGCLWSLGGPVLETKQGFSYQPVINQNNWCGPRMTWDIPPGVIFGGIGKTYEEAFVNFWGYVQFEIPENSDPLSITFSYMSNAWSDFTQSYGAKSTTVSIKSIEEIKQITNPFDEKYSNSLHIYRTGEEIKVGLGNLAKFTIQSAGTQSDGSLPVTMQITSLDEGYPLDFDISIGANSTYLIYQDASICCTTSIYDWGWDINLSVIGPQQSVIFGYTFQNPNQLKVWLVGEFVLVEKSAGEITDSHIFVVELP